MTLTTAPPLATTPFTRTPPDSPQTFPPTDVFPFIERFASRQGWQERIRRAIAFVSDHVLVLPPTFRIVWVCFNIGRNIFHLLTHKKLLESREQAAIRAATIGSRVNYNLWRRRSKTLHAMGEMEERDKLLHSYVDRGDTCSMPLAGSLAPELRSTLPSNPHDLASSFHVPSPPLAPPTLRLGDPTSQNTSLHTRSVCNPTEGEPAATDAETTSLCQCILIQKQSTRPIPREPVLHLTGVGPDSNTSHGSSSQPSPDHHHPSPPSPLAEWTPFIATGTSKAGYVKKRSRKSDFCGGFSDVFNAEIWFPAEQEPEFKQDVALKILRHVGLNGKSEDHVSTYLTKRLNQEIITWIRLVHPNVVPLLGFTIAPLPSLISPWYERGNLRSYLERYPSTNRMKLIFDVAKGLEHLHSQTPSIAHGDIKPENVLINEEGDALLSDFGLATVLGDEHFYTASHHGGGSFRYMAPELFRGEQRTCSADVYSFANLAYEILTNRPPHSGLEANVCDPNSSEDLIDDWSKDPELEPMADILRRCWVPSPEKRPSMKEIVQDLSPRVR